VQRIREMRLLMTKGVAADASIGGGGDAQPLLLASSLIVPELVDAELAGGIENGST